MKIYVFGNPDYDADASALQLIPQLKKKLAHIDFIVFPIDQEVATIVSDHLLILDVVQGIDHVTVITENQLDKLIAPPRFSVHDYDLGFQLKLLKKLGLLKKVTIIGLPYEKAIDTNEVISAINSL